VFGLGPATRIYVALGATDMRKGFDRGHGRLFRFMKGELTEIIQVFENRKMC
jgi:hypothetical protein